MDWEAPLKTPSAAHSPRPPSVSNSAPSPLPVDSATSLAWTTIVHVPPPSGWQGERETPRTQSASARAVLRVATSRTTEHSVRDLTLRRGNLSGRIHEFGLGLHAASPAEFGVLRAPEKPSRGGRHSAAELLFERAASAPSSQSPRAAALTISRKLELQAVPTPTKTNRVVGNTSAR